MKYKVVHHTSYSNSQPVSVGYNEVWLTPRATDRQAVLSHHIEIAPQPSQRSTLTDYFGNTVTQVMFNQGYPSLSISAVNEIEVLESPLDPAPPLSWEEVRDELRAHKSLDSLLAYEFTFASPRCRLAEEFADYGRESFHPQSPLREALESLLKRFQADFQYDPSATNVSTPVEQVLRQRRGVCQDFSHLLISVLRSLGLAARYVSGYLRTVPPPGKPRLVGADNSHAWLSVYAGNGHWIDIDPTNCQFPTTDHVTVAWGRDYTDVAPVKGVYVGGSSLQLRVSVDVCPMDEPEDASPETPAKKTFPLN